MEGKYRDYVVRKYIRARSVQEALNLESDYPVIEVNDMKEKPEVQNDEVVNAVGFSVPLPVDDEERE